MYAGYANGSVGNFSFELYVGRGSVVLSVNGANSRCKRVSERASECCCPRWDALRRDAEVVEGR